MQVATHQIINVISVRNALMSTVGAVNVTGLVSAALMFWRAALRIVSSRSQLMIVDMAAVHMVHVPVVKVVRMAVVPYRGVTATTAMRVGLPLMLFASLSHDFAPSFPLAKTRTDSIMRRKIWLVNPHRLHDKIKPRLST